LQAPVSRKPIDLIVSTHQKFCNYCLKTVTVLCNAEFFMGTDRLIEGTVMFFTK